MDERTTRSNAGNLESGRIHRVGLTRYCLASGVVQLPYALRDAFSEGDLLAFDHEGGEKLSLFVRPPRSLGGLKDFFERHDLVVNDLVEFHVTDEGIRVAAHRRPRKPARGRAASRSSRDAQRTGSLPASLPARGAPASASPSALPSKPSSTTTPPGASRGQAAYEHGRTVSEPAASDSGPARPGAWEDAMRGTVVQRFGSVTVRRVGGEVSSATTELAGPTMRPSEAPLAEPAERHDVSESPPQVHPPRAQGKVDATPAESRDAPRVVIGSGFEPRPFTFGAFGDARETNEIDEIAAFEDPFDGSFDGSFDRERRGREPRDATPPSSKVRGAPRGARRAGDGSGPASSRRAGSRSTERPAAADRGESVGATFGQGELPFAGDRARAEAAPASVNDTGVGAPTVAARATETVVETVAAERFVDANVGVEEVLGAVTTDRSVGRVSGSETPLRSDVERERAADDRRRRSSELSAAGDLRSRVVRWFLDPSTPVIVPVDRVARAFDLDLAVTVEVVDGIVEAPPPGLILTRIRHDVLRVARANVDRTG